MRNPKANKPAEHVPIVLRDTAASFQLRKIDLLQIPARDLARIYVDVATAAEAALAAIPRLEKYSDEIMRVYGSIADLVRELEISALAAWHANALAVKTPQDDLHKLREKAYEVRDDLLQWAGALSNRGKISSEKINQVELKRSYRDVAMDLLRLVDAFDENWEDINGKILVTRSEVDEARALSGRILDRIVGRRGDRTEGSPGPMEMRQRAFTRFLEDYRRVAHAIAFIVGPDGDPNEVLPPLSQAYLYGSTRRTLEAEVAPETGPIDVEGSVDGESEVAETPVGDNTGEWTSQPAEPTDADTPTPMSEPAEPSAPATASPSTPTAPVSEPTPPVSGPTPSGNDATESPPCATQPRAGSNGASGPAVLAPQ